MVFAFGLYGAFGDALGLTLARDRRHARGEIEDVGHGLADRRLRRLLPSVEPGVEGPADQAGVRGLGVAKLSGFVHSLPGQAEVRDSGLGVPVENASAWAIAAGGNLAPLLRGIVLVGQPALRLRPDLTSVGLGAVRGE